MARSLALLGSLALAAALAACGADDEPAGERTAPSGASPATTPPTSRSPAAGSPSTAHTSGAGLTAEDLRNGAEWEGDFTITIEVWDYCTGAGGLTQSGAYTRTESFSFATAAPVDEGPAARETNPFYVSAGTDPDEGGAVNLALASANVIASDDGSAPLVRQAWRLEYDAGHLTGELVEDDQEMGLAFNSFWDEDPLVTCRPELGMHWVRYLIKEGSTIDARIGADEVEVVIEGRSHNDMRRFRLEGTGTRSG